MNVVLFRTYYAVSKEALQRIDPVVFACAEMLLLLPVALALVLFMRSDLTREVWTRGSLLGSFFCGVLVLLAVTLKHTSATATAFSPCLNGMLAALFSWLVLRRTISNVTWAAALLAVLGMLLMMADSPLYGGVARESAGFPGCRALHRLHFPV